MYPASPSNNHIQNEDAALPEMAYIAMGVVVQNYALEDIGLSSRLGGPI